MKEIIAIFFLTMVGFVAYGQKSREMEWKKLSYKDSTDLNKTWNAFVQAIEIKDGSKLRNLALDKIDCDLCIETDYEKGPPEDYIIPVDTFINQALTSFVESPLGKAIKIRGYKASMRIVPDYKPRNLPRNYGKDLILYEVWIQTYLPNEWAKGHEGQSHGFMFVKHEGKFKLYGLSSVP